VHTEWRSELLGACNSRLHGFFNRHRTTRKATEFKVPGYEDVTQGVILSSDQKGLEFGVKANGQWKYQPLDLKPSELK
jgi:hypothetical protein